MAELTTTPILSVRTTVDSKVSDVAVIDGQLTFVRDKRKIILDYGGIRTIYTQIEELSTDAVRSAMLAPVSGLYYFVSETSVLWTYQNDWIQITTTPTVVTTLVEDALEQAKNNGDFKGEKGDRGDSGVYVGSGEMPADCNVQIDPDGDIWSPPTKGIDYWTDTDKAEIVADVIAALPVYNGEVIEL